MKKVREFPRLLGQEKKRGASKPNVFVFYEKSTGMAQFQAESTADHDCTVERMAGLLAMQCLVRGHNPDDFVVLVPAEKALVGRLFSRASELLEEGRSITSPVSLSPRQREILHSVICNSANKEIACKLNITVRTVKFHISSLLSKFGVQNRGELARRATSIVRPTGLEDQDLAFERLLPDASCQPLGPVAVKPTLRVASEARNVRSPGRILTA